MNQNPNKETPEQELLKSTRISTSLAWLIVFIGLLAAVFDSANLFTVSSQIVAGVIALKGVGKW